MKKRGRVVQAGLQELFLEEKELVLDLKRGSLWNREEEKEQNFKSGKYSMNVKNIKILLEATEQSILQERYICTYTDGN